jgi:RNA polymerase sigma factor (TIGR02999 family)
MSGERTSEMTRLLAAWRAGDASAPESLAELVYNELRAMAARRLSSAQPKPLQTTELVHETFTRLLEHPLAAQDRIHFFRTAALAMRQALVDAIRRNVAEKRGGGALVVSLSAASDLAVAGPEAWLGVEAALAALEQEDPRKCRVVEMSFLLGLSNEETATTLGVSVPTVERDLRFARAWLKDRLAS